jgi:response regulator NasT
MLGKGGKIMENALIISGTGKNAALITEMLTAASINHISCKQSCAEARRLLLDRDFDLVIVNAPLHDESGESLSRHITSKGSAQVILIVKGEYFDEAAAACEADGVLTISKPLDRALFWSALALAKSAQNRIKRIQAENAQLRQKIEDIRIVDRAKLVLVSYMNMNEKEAHRFIEKQAMDLRSTRRSIAEGILRTYEN